eukprot:Gb_08752 [translate_table: standard]
MPKGAGYLTQSAYCNLMHSSFQAAQISMASITNILPQFCFGTLFVVTIFLGLVEGSVRKCPEKCGSLTVDYPFGIKNSACIAHPGFEIACKENSGLGRGLLPFLPTPSGEFQILNISIGSLIINSTSLKATSCTGTDDAWNVLRLPDNGPFTISDRNVFVVIGCNSSGSYTNGEDNEEPYQATCKAGCLINTKSKYCNNYSCCTNCIKANWQFISFTGGGRSNGVSGKCGFSTIFDPATFSTTEPGVFGSGEYGLKLDWAIGHQSCSTASPGCSKHANCSDMRDGYVCTCQEGYEGDGYSNSIGCTDVDECSKPELNECFNLSLARCINLPGSYNCSCFKGQGDGFKNGSRCELLSSNGNATIPAILGSFSTLLGVALAGIALLWMLKKRYTRLVKLKYFEQNGGIRLQNYIASKGGRESARIFSAEEIKKATNNFRMI